MAEILNAVADLRAAIADLPYGEQRVRAKLALDLLTEALGLGHPIKEYQ